MIPRRDVTPKEYTDLLKDDHFVRLGDGRQGFVGVYMVDGFWRGTILHIWAAEGQPVLSVLDKGLIELY